MSRGAAVKPPEVPAAVMPQSGTGIATDPYRAKQDMAIMHRAVKEGWQIPKADLEELPAIASHLARSFPDPMVQLAAVRVLVAMHGQNLQQERPRAAPQRPGTQVNIFAGQLPPAALTALATADRAIAQLPVPIPADPSPASP